METFIITAILGLLISVLGAVNMTGNISSLHWYHRQRVSEKDRKPFGRLVGLGTLIIGISLILFGILFWISESIQLGALVTVGAVALVVFVLAGLAISFYAMIKYNKGIF